MHIGLIGGIGPAATAAYYLRLTRAMRERDRPLDLTIVNADMDTLIHNNLDQNKDAQAEIYARHIQQLARAGAECAAITSLGGHYCFEETKQRSVLPLVSGVAPLDEYFAAQGLSSVGLLGTRIVMETKLYGQLTQTQAIIPVQTQDVGQAYLSLATAGTCSDAVRAYFFEQGRALIDQGASAVVLAGTDLGLAFDGHDPGFPVVDALDVHVARLAALACGEQSL